MSKSVYAAVGAALLLLLAACDRKPATPPAPIIGTSQSDNMSNLPAPASMPGLPASATR